MLSVKGVKDMASKEWLVQLPFIAMVSICSGLLGALFNALHKLLRRVSQSSSFRDHTVTSCSASVADDDCSFSQACSGIAWMQELQRPTLEWLQLLHSAYAWDVLAGVC